MSHEMTNEEEMSSYFSKKFAPAVPVFVIGRSYKSDPHCKPEHTLFDNWMDRSHPHLIGCHCRLCAVTSTS